MASSSSKTLMNIFQPSKRLKVSSETLITKSTVSSLCKSSSSDNGAAKTDSASKLTPEQRARMEFNKSQAKARRNLKICSQRVPKSKERRESLFGKLWNIHLNHQGENGWNQSLTRSFSGWESDTAARAYQHSTRSQAEGRRKYHREDEGMSFTKLEELLPEETWLEALPGELHKPYAKNLFKFVEGEMRGSVPIYPPPHLIFNALNSTPFDRVKAVIIGQDPYHGPGQAMGLSFSVPKGIKIPSSLGNIFKELKVDLGCSTPSHGDLERWALQGVLLLNTVLTVRSHQANSHAKKGWETFTDSVIQAISLRKSGVVFLLWGNSAQAKSRFIDESKHHILKAAHPSGLSANRGFFGCRHFSQTNQLLERQGLRPIDWQI